MSWGERLYSAMLIGFVVLFGTALLGVAVALGGFAIAAFEGPPAAFCPKSFNASRLAKSSDVEGRTAPYCGAGPHLVAVYLVLERDSDELEVVDRADDGRMVDVTSTTLPEQWRAPERVDADGKSRSNEVQLLVCEYRHGIRAGATVGVCEPYTTPDRRVPVSSATYTYQMYEASTARPLGTFELPGESYVCPEWIISEDQPRVVAVPEKAEVISKLRPFVEAAR